MRQQGTVTSSARPLRVLHVITGLGQGGAETMLCKLVAAADRARFHHSIVSLTGLDAIGQKILELGVPVTALGMNPSFPSPSKLVPLFRLLKSETPDILQTWLYHADFLGLLTGRLAGIRRVVWSIRCSYVAVELYPFKLRFLIKLLAMLSRFPDAILTNSRAGMVEHERLGYRNLHWVVIPNGFDTRRFKPSPEARENTRHNFGIPPGAPVVGLVARFDAMKDHGNFIDAAHRLLLREPTAHFILVGRGVECSNPFFCERIDGTALSGRFHLLGEQSDVSQIIPAFDVGVLSSLGEGFPNVLGEIMACGVPCVTTDVGDCGLIIGDTGRVVPARDSAALGDAIAGLLALPVAERERKGLAARTRIEEQFGMSRVITAYEKFYSNLGGNDFALELPR
jgi:glycosyltransferase involved in cell wall biosynthesis